MRNFLGGGLLALTLFSTSLNIPQFVKADAPSVEELKEVSIMSKRVGERENLKDVPTELRPLIAASSAKYNVPEALFAGLIKKETEFRNIWGYDGTGRGLAQIDSYWHPEVSDNEAFDPSYALPWAAKYLKGLKEQYGNWYNALRAYNGGSNYASSGVGYITTLYANTIYEFAKEYAVQAKIEAIVEIPESKEDVKSKSAQLIATAFIKDKTEEAEKKVEEAKSSECSVLSCTLPVDFQDITNIAQSNSEVEPEL